MYHKLPHLVLQKNTPVTLLSELWEDAVVATKGASQLDANNDPADHCFLRIRKDTGMSVVPGDSEAADGNVKLQDEASVKKLVDYKFLCEKTRDMFQNFNLSDISQHIFLEDPVWPSFEEVQSYLYNHTLHEYEAWKDFVQLKRPEQAFKGQTSKKPKSKDANLYENVRKRDDYSQLEPVDLKVTFCACISIDISCLKASSNISGGSPSLSCACLVCIMIKLSINKPFISSVLHVIVIQYSCVSLMGVVMR